MGQAGREGGILDKRLFLALDESSEEQDSLLDDPLIARSRGNLADGDVYLSEGGKLDARMGQRAAALVAEDVCELLEADLEVLGGVYIFGEVRGLAPCSLRPDISACTTTMATITAMTTSVLVGLLLTSRFAYSFSKRCNRLAGSFA